MPPEDNHLRFIEQFEHRRHVVKIGRRGDQIRLLVYPPNSNLATHMFVDELANYEQAIQKVRAFIERSAGIEIASLFAADDPE